MLEEALGKKKGSKRAQTHKTPHKNYKNHQVKKGCEISPTLSSYCFNYFIKVHIYQCIKLWVSMYTTLCISVSSRIHQIIYMY
jgi:hypothetical protein